MPSANGHGPRDVGISGSLVGWLVGCLVAWLLGWLIAWLLGWLIGLLVEWLAPNQPKIDQDRLPNPPKIHQVGGQNPLQSVPRGLLESSWAILGPRWPQEGSKSENVQKTQTFPPSSWGASWSQNRPKIDLEAIQNMIVFLIAFGIDFWSHLELTWPHLGSQNPPKMDPSWL